MSAPGGFSFASGAGARASSGIFSGKRKEALLSKRLFQCLCQSGSSELLRTVSRLLAALAFAEVAFKQTLEGLAVTGFVAGHFMNGVMNGVEVRLLRALREIGLAFGSAVFSFNAHFEVLLGGVGQNFAKQFGKAGSVIGFFHSGLFIVQADFRITFTESNAGHREIHTDFGAFAVEVGTEVVLDVFGNILGNAKNVLGSPGLALNNRNKLGFRCAAGRSCPGVGQVSELHAFAFFIIDVSANCATIFHIFLPFINVLLRTSVYQSFVQ